MKSFLKIFFSIALALIVVSCNKDDGNEAVPLRDYAEQYASDLATIQTFLKTHAMTLVGQDVTYTVVPELDPTSIWGTDANSHNANLLEWPVEKDGITYIIYYLQLTQGSAPESVSPCNFDSVLAAYKGQLIDDDMTVFDSNDFPQNYLSLTGAIRGWSEILPKFKSGSMVGNPDGTISYSNFGSGVMFLPSGLAYYANFQSGIPPYSPLIFSFRLLSVQRNDNDNDGIYSYLEDLNGDGYIRDYDITGSYEDDTDHDGVPDALDVDDDGDGKLTKEETKVVTSLGNTYYYPFNGAAVDNPLTTDWNETEGIPSCSGDYTTPTRLRKHLDPTCQ